MQDKPRLNVKEQVEVRKFEGDQLVETVYLVNGKIVDVVTHKEE